MARNRFRPQLRLSIVQFLGSVLVILTSPYSAFSFSISPCMIKQRHSLDLMAAANIRNKHSTSSKFLLGLTSNKPYQLDPEKERDSNSNKATDEQTQTAITIPPPSIRRIISFAIPSIGVYLCSPVLSLIDTSIVGMFCGTLPQAALNPAVTIIDYSARAMSFLYTGTLNMFATLDSNNDQEDTRGSNNTNISVSQTAETLAGALQLSLLVGAGLGMILLTTSRKLLVPLIGNDTIDPKLLHAAWQYVAIRSLGFPAAAMIGTSQAACLGMKDNATPFRIIVFTAVFNLVLDVLLVRMKWNWIGGTAGVAWATTISQYVAVGLFLRKFTQPTKTIMSPDAINANTNIRNSINDATAVKEKDDIGRTSIRSTRLRQFWRFPKRNVISQFSPYVIPVTITQVGRCSTYIAMGHVVSSTLDLVSMAAQQIITSIFYALIPIGDSCSLTAQSFLPAILSKTQQSTPNSMNDPTRSTSRIDRDKKQQSFKNLDTTIFNIYKVAGMLGIILASIVACIPLACPLLTTDPTVTAQVITVVPIIAAVMSTHGFFCASEGMLLGMKDLKFLGNIYAVFFGVVPLLMLRLKYLTRAGVTGIGLVSVWNVFLGYQAFRISAFASRVFLLRGRFYDKSNRET